MSVRLEKPIKMPSDKNTRHPAEGRGIAHRVGDVCDSRDARTRYRTPPFGGVVLGLVAVLLFNSLPAHAIAIPPAAIDEQAVTPSCIMVQPTYLFGDDQVYGTDGKGPAIRIENACAAAITIEKVSTGKRMDLIDAGNVKDKELLTKAERFIFVPDEDNCRSVRNDQQTLQAEQAEKSALRKAQMEEAASAEELLEHAAKMPVETPDSRPVICGRIILQPAALLVLAMPWETAYEITGTPDVKISGQMINPLDVNSPETFQFAQNGDKVTRYMLALHNIGTGQNLKLALRWLNEAAEQGYRPAILQLAECYESGKCGVAKDAKEALFWRTLGRGDIVRHHVVQAIVDAYEADADLRNTTGSTA